MAGELDKQLEELTQLIKKTADRTDTKFDALADRTDAKFDAFGERTDAKFDAFAESTDTRFHELTHLVKRTAGRLDELSLEVRDLRKEVGQVRTGLGEVHTGLRETNDKLNSLHAEIAGVVVSNTQRIQGLESRVDIIEGQTH